MSTYLMPVLLAACGAVLACLLTGLQVRSNGVLHLTREPRTDRWHTKATPSSGGMAIFLAAAVMYCLWFPGQHLAIALGAAAVWLLGLFDDVIQLPPWAKLLGQFAASAYVVGSGIVFHATGSDVFNLVFSVVWLVGITNAFNLIDNMDGLCAGVAIIIAGLRFSLLAVRGDWNDANLCVLIGAAYAGFLVWNYKPAKIFMGDCGSMFAGFSLAALTIATPVAHTKAFVAGILYPVLTFMYPIFDTMLVSVLRKIAGRPISHGGRDHSSHRLVMLGLSEQRVVWTLWLLTALGSGIGLMVHWTPAVMAAAGAILLIVLLAFGVFLSALPVYSGLGANSLASRARLLARRTSV